MSEQSQVTLRFRSFSAFAGVSMGLRATYNAISRADARLRPKRQFTSEQSQVTLQCQNYRAFTGVSKGFRATYNAISTAEGRLRT